MTKREREAREALAHSGIDEPTIVELGKIGADYDMPWWTVAEVMVKIARLHPGRRPLSVHDGLALVVYELRRLSSYKRNRPALRLLRQFLTPEQQRQLRSTRAFDVEVGANRYRLIPGTGAAQRLRRAGRVWRYDTMYCLHESEGVAKQERVPPADLSLAHLLMLVNDEAGFLATANATPRR
jgi:hypothetical protein